jgi:hypothetical protein
MQQGRHEEKPTACQRAVVEEKVVPSERKPGHRSTVTTQSKTPHAPRISLSSAPQNPQSRDGRGKVTRDNPVPTRKRHKEIYKCIKSRTTKTFRSNPVGNPVCIRNTDREAKSGTVLRRKLFVRMSVISASPRRMKILVDNIAGTDGSDIGAG